MTRSMLFLSALMLAACGAQGQVLGPLDDVTVDWVGWAIDPNTGLPEPNAEPPVRFLLVLQVSVLDGVGVPVAGSLVHVTSCSADVTLYPRAVVDDQDPGLGARVDAAGGTPVEVGDEFLPAYNPGFAEVATDPEGNAEIFVWVEALVTANDGTILPCPITISGGQDQTQIRLVPRS